MISYKKGRHVMRFFRSVAMVAALATLGISTSATAAASWNGIGHKLKVKLDGPATKSIWVAGTPAPGYEGFAAWNSCIVLSNAPTGWMDFAHVAKNGTFLKVIAFESRDCTNGYRREKGMTVPGNDGLDFVWLALF